MIAEHSRRGEKISNKDGGIQQLDHRIIGETSHQEKVRIYNTSMIFILVILKNKKLSREASKKLQNIRYSGKHG